MKLMTRVLTYGIILILTWTTLLRPHWLSPPMKIAVSLTIIVLIHGGYGSPSAKIPHPNPVSSPDW